jgi:hypothetical protein
MGSHLPNQLANSRYQPSQVLWPASQSEPERLCS